jgi:hypothetical protein
LRNLGAAKRLKKGGFRVELGQHLGMILPSIAAVEITTLGFRHVPGSQPCLIAPVPR